ncbi:MAG: hypothetical protein ACK53I_08530, partial [Phenylobacterium sp.]
MSGESGLELDQYLPYRLSVASNAVSGLIARAYEDRFGLTIPQWRLLCVLAEDGGLTQVQIVSRQAFDLGKYLAAYALAYGGVVK